MKQTHHIVLLLLSFSLLVCAPMQPGPSSAKIQGVATSITAFVDFFRQGPTNKAVRIASMHELDEQFGGLDERSEASYGIRQFFLNGGTEAWVVRVASRDDGLPDAIDIIGDLREKTGIYALETVDILNLLCVPRATFVGSRAGEFTVAQSNAIIAAGESYCAERRALFLMDSPGNLDGPQQIRAWLETNVSLRHRNAALFFPGVTVTDPLDSTLLRLVGPSGAIAGMLARLDASRGVWKAPAGAEATLKGVSGLSYQVTDQENTMLASLGVNCLRTSPDHGIVCWGARTLEGSAEQNSEWRYISVCRLALYLEESVDRGTQWAVFEPNGELLWASLRSTIGDFMSDLWREGALAGVTPQSAYFVKCDNSTTSQTDIEEGRLNFLIGFAPLRPSEFVILRISQLTAPNGRENQ